MTTLIRQKYLYSLLINQVIGRSKLIHDKALINCQYSMATFSTQDRKNRPRGGRKSMEMTMHLKQTFDAVILTELYPKTQIDIYVEVGCGIVDNFSVGGITLIIRQFEQKYYEISLVADFLKIIVL